TLLRVGGYAWFGMLLFSPLLLLLTGRARALFATLFLAGHASFAFTVRIGAFPFVGIAGVLLFFPSGAWNDAEGALRRSGAPWKTVRRASDIVGAAGEHVAKALPPFRLRLGPD